MLAGLAFAPRICEIVRGGLYLRNHLEVPGRQFLLGHAVREIRNRIAEYTAAFFNETLPSITRAEEIANVSQEWLRDVSPLYINASEHPDVELTEIRMSVATFRRFDQFMRDHAELNRKLIDRTAAGLMPLRPFVPPEVFDAAARKLVKLKAHKVGHIGDVSQPEVPEQTVNDLWDRLEAILFDLYGSPAVLEATDDRIAKELNAL
jgi:hypothetical protein